MIHQFIAVIYLLFILNTRHGFKKISVFSGRSYLLRDTYIRSKPLTSHLNI